LALLASLPFAACGGDQFKADDGSGATAGSAAAGSAGQSGSGGAAGAAATGGASGRGATGGSGATGGDAGGSGGATADAGSVDASDAGRLGLEQFCSATAESYCAAAKPCCARLFSFDEASCRTKYLADCAKEVQAVAATTKSYHPEYVSECQSSLKRLLGICTPTARELLEEFDGMRACGLVFQGQKTQGQVCGTDSDCKPSANANVLMSCGGLFQVFGLGTCQRTTALPQGANCEVGAGSTLAEVCRAGLYCDIEDDVAVGQEPYQGTCQPVAADGAECKPLGGYDIQCGVGAYCVEGHCRPSLSGGAGCAAGKHEQCLSNYCNPYVGNTCLPLVQMVTEKDCGSSVSAQ